MRKNQYIRFYPIKGRRIKKIRGYVRLKKLSDLKVLRLYCNESDSIFDSVYEDIDLTYYDIIKIISLQLDIHRIEFELRYKNATLYIILETKTIEINLRNEFLKALKINSLMDYVRRTIWIRK